MILNPAVRHHEKPPMLRQAQHERFFVGLTIMASSPFALSSPHGGRVEGFSTYQPPDLG